MGFKYSEIKSNRPQRMRESITPENVVSILEGKFTRPEKIIEDLKGSPGTMLCTKEFAVTFVDEVDSSYRDADVKEIMDRIYDTLFENVGMTRHHIKFLNDEVSDQEVSSDRIYFSINGENYILTLYKFESERDIQ